MTSESLQGTGKCQHPVSKMKGLNLTQQQQQLVLERPIDVACFFGSFWEMHDLIPLDAAKEIMVRHGSKLDRLEDYWLQDKNCQFGAAILEARHRTFSELSRLLPDEPLFYSDAASCLYLVFIGSESRDGVQGQDEGMALASRFNLKWKDAECMWSCLDSRRISENIVIGLFGDDRGYVDGTYYVAACYAPIDIAQAWARPDGEWYPTFH